MSDVDWSQTIGFAFSTERCRDHSKPKQFDGKIYRISFPQLLARYLNLSTRMKSSPNVHLKCSVLLFKVKD